VHSVVVVLHCIALLHVTGDFQLYPGVLKSWWRSTVCIACLLHTGLSLVPPQLLVVSIVIYRLCDIAILIIAIAVADRTA